MRIVLLVTLAVAALGTCANAEESHKTANAGVATPVGGYAAWDLNCNGGLAPVEIVAQPKHGSIDQRREAITITRVAKGSANCSGRSTLTTRRFYTSSPGLRGSDSFSVEATLKTGTIEDHYILAVH
jgi:hypothetical protein